MRLPKAAQSFQQENLNSVGGKIIESGEVLSWKGGLLLFVTNASMDNLRSFLSEQHYLQ